MGIGFNGASGRTTFGNEQNVIERAVIPPKGDRLRLDLDLVDAFAVTARTSRIIGNTLDAVVTDHDGPNATGWRKHRPEPGGGMDKGLLLARGALVLAPADQHQSMMDIVRRVMHTVIV